MKSLSIQRKYYYSSKAIYKAILMLCISVFLMNAAVSTSIANDNSAEVTTKTPFDFDGDSKADFAVFRPSNGTWYIMQSRGGFRAVNWGLSTDLLAPADYDGDGKTDIGVFRPSNGSWYYLRSSDNQFYGVQFGQNGDLPTPGDFDGDKKADINVFRPSDGNWYRLNSSNGQFNAVPFGVSTDIPQIADFDGDGKNDITVYRESNQSFNSAFYWIESSTGTIKAHQVGSEGWIITPALADFNADGKTDFSWFIKNYSTLYVRGIWSTPFGTANDGITKIPVPADYDGDGKAETAVFYTNNGPWFYNKIDSGTIERFNWGMASDRPVEGAYNR